MKAVAIIAALAVLAAVGLTLVPEASAYKFQLTVAALAAAAVTLIAVLAVPKAPGEPKPAKAEAVKPAPVPVAANQAEAEIVSFLATLQEKGRFVDFLMDDITAYSDAQVGAASRVVHSGCKKVLQEHFSVHPIREEAEGSAVTVAAGYLADEYRLVGKITGEAPFSGTLIHRGWKTDSVTLPRVLKTGSDRLPTIAPAEVELK